jgi:hypothetical protein
MSVDQPRSSRKLAPLAECDAAVFFEVLPVVEMPLLIEMIVN